MIDRRYLFGNDFDIDDIIWMGLMPTVSDLGKSIGAEGIGKKNKLEEELKSAIRKGRKIHYLPPYRADIVLEIERILVAPHIVHTKGNQLIIGAYR